MEDLPFGRLHILDLLRKGVSHRSRCGCGGSLILAVSQDR